MKATLNVRCEPEQTPRLQQLEGMFDLGDGETKHRCRSWEINAPIEERDWQIGLIKGPSGSGKSTAAEELFRGINTTWFDDLPPWPKNQCLADGFEDHKSVKEITEILAAVGLASPPTWLRPYHTLSTGEKWRADLAKLLTWGPTRSTRVMDEFTSVVDRTVAQIGSAALAKFIRRGKERFIAVTCHNDVEEWLQPDWVLEPGTGTFSWRLLRRRPRIRLEVSRCDPSAWKLFRQAHYLSGNLASGAWCWVAFWLGRPVCFSAWLPWVGSGPPARREHRTVCLPDYQGVGIGNALSDRIAAMWQGLGYVARSTTTHPAMVRSRCDSKNWRMTRAPSLAKGGEQGKFKAMKRATGRLTAGFKYVGPAMERGLAALLLGT